jgi:putative protein kinase ArgK-like GTPase of G3E family
MLDAAGFDTVIVETIGAGQGGGRIASKPRIVVARAGA